MTGTVNVLMGASASGGGTFAAEVSTTVLTGTRNGKGTVQTSSSVLCTPVNGVAPFTYLWTFHTGDTEIYSNTPTLNQTVFSAFAPNPGDVFIGTWRCTITDATLATATSPDVNITLSRGS